jgi:ComF family protein
VNEALAEAAAGDAVRRFARAALDVLLPPQCPVCNALVESEGVLCAECWPDVDFLGPPQCHACGMPFAFEMEEGALCAACARDRPPFARARAVMAYGDVSRKMILAFKHGDRTDTAPALGRWLVRAGAALIADADLVAPVPLHWTRLFQRRYNQAALLAHAVGRRAGLKVIADLVERRRRTRPQVRMGPSARRRNLKGAFRVHPKRLKAIQGRRVLLVDDVMTTGLTAAGCASALLAAGAAAVDVLTVARVVRPAF